MDKAKAQPIFWKIIAMLAIILWIVTLYIWYMAQSQTPQYMKSESEIIDLKNNKALIWEDGIPRWVDIKTQDQIDQDKYKKLEEIFKNGSTY